MLQKKPDLEASGAARVLSRLHQKRRLPQIRRSCRRFSIIKEAPAMMSALVLCPRTYYDRRVHLSRRKCYVCSWSGVPNKTLGVDEGQGLCQCETRPRMGYRLRTPMLRSSGQLPRINSPSSPTLSFHFAPSAAAVCLLRLYCLLLYEYHNTSGVIIVKKKKMFCIV